MRQVSEEKTENKAVGMYGSNGEETDMGKLIGQRLTLGELRTDEDTAARVFAAPPEMDTPRLRLRKIRMRDAEDLYSWSQDPGVAKYVLWDAHRSIRETLSYIRYMKSLYRQGAPCSWAVVERESGKVIGTIGVMNWSPAFRSVEVGYSFGRAWWGRGYATEALLRLMKLLFEQGGINRIEGMCDVRNPASARVMQKSGMKREGILRQRIYNKGEFADVMLFAALAKEWK